MHEWTQIFDVLRVTFAMVVTVNIIGCIVCLVISVPDWIQIWSLERRVKALDE